MAADNGNGNGNVNVNDDGNSVGHGLCGLEQQNGTDTQQQQQLQELLLTAPAVQGLDGRRGQLRQSPLPFTEHLQLPYLCRFAVSNPRESVSNAVDVAVAVVCGHLRPSAVPRRCANANPEV